MTNSTIDLKVLLFKFALLSRAFNIIIAVAVAALFVAALFIFVVRRLNAIDLRLLLTSSILTLDLAKL